MKKLTVCIPTHKRPLLVTALLESIFAQLRNYDLIDKVAVRVSDNDLDFKTRDGVLPLMERSSDIDVKYNKNEKNTETYNFIHVTDMAESEYVWIVGDDDTLVDGAIARIYSELEHGTDILICNVYHCDREMKRNLGVVYTLNREIESRDFDFSRREDALEYLCNAASKNAIFTFLSNVVFRKSTWASDRKREQFVKLWKSQAEQSYMHLETLMNGASLRYIKDVLVNYRSDNDYNESYSKGLFFRHHLSLQLEGIRNAIIAANPDEELKRVLVKILVKDISIFSFCGHNTTDLENRLIEEFYTTEEIELYRVLDIKIDDLTRLYNEGCKIVLFGASFLGERVLNKLKKLKISPGYFADNNASRWHETHCGLSIISPDEIVEMQKKDAVLTLISSIYVKEIYSQLKELGVQKIKMMDYR